MSLKNRLRISIVALVAVLMLAQSVLSLTFLARATFNDAFERAQGLAQQVLHLVTQRVNEKVMYISPPPVTQEEIKDVLIRLVEEDPALPSLLEKTMASSTSAVEILVCSDTGRILVSSSPSQTRLTFQSLPDLADWQSRPIFDRLFEVLTTSNDYTFVLPLGIDDPPIPIMTVRVVVSTVLMREAIAPQVRNVLLMLALSLLGALIIAALFSNVLLRSLERLAKQIDSIATGLFEAEPAAHQPESKEFAAVQSKLSVLGRQFRGAREDVAQLRGNIERMLSRLVEALLLFDSDLRLIRASRSADKLLGSLVLGERLDALFPDARELRALVTESVAAKRPVSDAILGFRRAGMPPMRLQVSVEMLESFPEPGKYGVLIALRDAETHRQIRSQLDISTRLAAISRLTGGVAHEIKNPLNAMALHLEVLRNRLAQNGDEYSEIDVIDREISRLDRVVKTFLDFTRPVDLAMTSLDLAEIARQVASLVKPEAERRRIVVKFEAAAERIPIRGDEDLLKQALLNVVNNGIEAIGEGGTLAVRVQIDGGEAALTVADNGPGIPPEVRDKIFNLYFTTKTGGSGIGLAMTFRVVQLHNASMDFETTPGEGTVFRLRFPIAGDEEPEGSLEAAEPEPVNDQAVGVHGPERV
jgi:signal transduction histidine kinase